VAVVFCFCCTISVTTKADVGIDDFAADPNLLFFVTNFFKIHDPLVEWNVCKTLIIVIVIILCFMGFNWGFMIMLIISIIFLLHGCFSVSRSCSASSSFFFMGVFRVS
jgi:hypothetical protein